METLLTLSVGGFPPLSARNCEQILCPVEIGQLKRTINGELIHLGAQPLKYWTQIICQDKTALATAGLHRGAVVTVGCIQRLCQYSEGDATILERDAVPGSIIVMTDKQKILDSVTIDRQVRFESEMKAFVSYRPYLKIRIISHELTTNEWGLTVGWKIVGEEI